MDRGAWRATVHGGLKELDMTQQITLTAIVNKQTNKKFHSFLHDILSKYARKSDSIVFEHIILGLQFATQCRRCTEFDILSPHYHH